MSVRIDRELCVGCGKCADICPGNLISLKETPHNGAKKEPPTRVSEK